MSERLSPHFTLAELTRTGTGLPNTPNSTEKANLKALAAGILEPIRAEFGKPLIVNSGFRSEAVNAQVGGSSTSQHRTGDAADVKPQLAGDYIALWKATLALADAGLQGLDQAIIYEKRSHLHVGRKAENARGMLLVKLLKPNASGKSYQSWGSYQGSLRDDFEAASAPSTDEELPTDETPGETTPPSETTSQDRPPAEESSVGESSTVEKPTEPGKVEQPSLPARALQLAASPVKLLGRAAGRVIRNPFGALIVGLAAGYFAKTYLPPEAQKQLASAALTYSGVASVCEDELEQCASTDQGETGPDEADSKASTAESAPAAESAPPAPTTEPDPAPVAEPDPAPPAPAPAQP